jgi:ParB family transcriptional regulator, chromosome partitioning protein
MTASNLAVHSDSTDAEAVSDGPAVTAPAGPDAADPSGSDRGENTDPVLLPRPMLPVSLLSPHPDNVREDLHLDDEFVASFAETGVLVPLRIVPAATGSDETGEDGGVPVRYYVVDGCRRLAGAMKAGLAEVPVDLADGHEGKASHYLDMFNTNRHRRDLTPLEEAGALFAASREGATRTRIRKATGLGKEEVNNALKAGKLSDTTRLKTTACYDVNLEQYALLQEFDSDQDAVDKLLAAFSRGESGQHTAERIRAEHQARAEADQALARYRDDGYQVSTDGVPAGAMILPALSHDGEDLTPERHQACPDRGIVFRHWAPGSPVHFCTDPAANGHDSRPGTAANATAAGEGGSQDENAGHPPLPLSQPAPGTGPDLKTVIEGNRAWTAAATVRRAFLTSLFTRGTATRDMALFAASQLLTMPGTLRSKLTIAPHRDLFTELTGALTPDRLDKWTTGKLPMLSLALIVTAYEEQLSGDSGKLTWRRDKFSPCSQDDAGTYFRFLVSTGYELSPIEQAITDGVEYTGDSPDVPPLAEGASDPAAEPDAAPQADGQAA